MTAGRHRMTTRMACTVVCAIVCACTAPATAACAATRHAAPQVSAAPTDGAEAACLIDVASGRILYAKRADKPLRIASLTKIMTGYLAVCSGKWNRIVTVSAHAARQEGSSVYLAAGEKHSLKDLTYAMMLRSGNDAAMAIAEYLGGSQAGFSALMNREARALGALHSHFSNPSGLDAPDHLISAHDLALICRAALRNKTFAQVVRTRSYTMSWPGQKWDRRMRNKNKLLWMMAGADGIKTGYTKKAGRCLASSASLDGHQVALVLLRDGSDWVDAQRLLNYGLKAFERRDVASWIKSSFSAKVRFGEARQVALAPRGRLLYPVRADEEREIVPESVRIRTLSAPVRPGQVAGTVEYRLHGEVIGRLPLVTVEQVRAKGMFGRLREWLLG